jgi:hypothetical protein
MQILQGRILMQILLNNTYNYDYKFCKEDFDEQCIRLLLYLLRILLEELLISAKFFLPKFIFNIYKFVGIVQQNLHVNGDFSFKKSLLNINAIVRIVQQTF